MEGSGVGGGGSEGEEKKPPEGENKSKWKMKIASQLEILEKTYSGLYPFFIVFFQHLFFLANCFFSCICLIGFFCSGNIPLSGTMRGDLDSIRSLGLAATYVVLSLMFKGPKSTTSEVPTQELTGTSWAGNGSDEGGGK